MPSTISLGLGCGRVNQRPVRHEAGPGGYEDFAVDNTTAILNPGDNLLAVQMFNDYIGNNDSSIDAGLVPPAPFSETSPPTPGAANTVASAEAAPNIRHVEISAEGLLQAEEAKLERRKEGGS